MSSEDQEALLNQISQLAGESPRAIRLLYIKLTLLGQINRHKNGQVLGQQQQTHQGYGGTKPHQLMTEWETDRLEGYPQPTTGWRGSRGSYRGSRGSRGFVRGGRHNPIHRNKSLVLNASSASSPSTNENTNPTESGSSAAWVSKNEPGHRQIVNATIFEKETRQRVKSMEELRLQKLKRRDQQERAKLQKQVKLQKSHEVIVGGGVFRVNDSGAKLEKISGEEVFAEQWIHCYDSVN